VICPNCGTSNLDTSSICANCGRPLHGSASVPPPPDVNAYTPPPPPPGAGAYTPPPPPRMGGAPYGQVPAAPIPNYLVQSILATLCCCMPLGIVALIFAAQVNSKLAAGDVAGAAAASSKARMFCWIAVAVALVGWVLIVLINGAAVLSGFANAG
jgi:hypothetical protein